MKKLFQLLAFVFLIYGASIFLGFLTGAKSMLHPFKTFTAGKMLSQIATTTDVEAKAGYTIAKLKAEVEASSKPVVVDFRKDSCASCDELEEFTFPDPAVQEELKRFTFISIDVTANGDAEKALLKYYKLQGTPNIIFFDKDNNHLPKKDMAGFVPADKFTKHLKTM